MVAALRLVYASAALLATAAGLLVTASLFIASRAPQSTKFLGISLVVSAIFVVAGVVLFGIQRHVAAIAASARDRSSEPAQERALHVDRLVAYLLAAGAFVCVVLALLAYAILARIHQGFAVFG